MSESNPGHDFDSNRSMEIVRYVKGSQPIRQDDYLATEEPLEIRVLFSDGDKKKNRSLSITMRTPGNDECLAAGFLATEGIINSADDIQSIEWSGPTVDGQANSNQIIVELADHVTVDLSDLQRHFYTTSSCGICGKASLDAVRSKIAQPVPITGARVSPNTIYGLPDLLRERQAVFDQTGGLHAAGLFSFDGNYADHKEDVGRHNAVDKLIGRQLLDAKTPLADSIIVVSGRASFELVQKAVSVGVPMMVAVGAPSTLAVELAREFSLTLIGFTSAKRFNVYSVEDRMVK